MAKKKDKISSENSEMGESEKLKFSRQEYINTVGKTAYSLLSQCSHLPNHRCHCGQIEDFLPTLRYSYHRVGRIFEEPHEWLQRIERKCYWDEGWKPGALRVLRRIPLPWSLHPFARSSTLFRICHLSTPLCYGWTSYGTQISVVCSLEIYRVFRNIFTDLWRESLRSASDRLYRNYWKGERRSYEVSNILVRGNEDHKSAKVQHVPSDTGWSPRFGKASLSVDEQKSACKIVWPWRG